MTERAEKTELGIEEICERLQELERRVAALERLPEGAGMKASATGDGGARDSAQGKRLPGGAGIRAGAAGDAARATSAVPVLGKAVLAIAGAYLLRAIAESGAAPRWILLAAGIAYAGAWLVLAARAHRKSHFASGVYGLTVAFMLAPLLWEGTVRFGNLTAGVAAAVLVVYVAGSLALSWKEKLEAIPWIAVVAAVGTVVTLVIATHELSALTIGLLLMALTTEAAAWSGRWLGLRAVTGLGADFAVGVLALVMTAEGGAPAGYRPMSAGEVNTFCLALVGIYGVSMAVRGFGLLRPWTILEMAQAVVAFGLGTWVSLRATAGGSAEALGAMFLALAGVCYWGVLRRFAGSGVQERVISSGAKAPFLASQNVGAEAPTPGALTESEAEGVRPTPVTPVDARWNRRVSANYAAALVLAGSFLLLGGDAQVVLLSMAAVAAVVVFTRTEYLSLGIHGTFYLLAAGIVCGLFGYAARALAGTAPGWPGWSFGVVALAGLGIYVVGTRASGEGWRTRTLWVVPAAVVGFALAAVVIAGIAGIGAGELSASRLSMVRTVVTCVMALGMAYAGSRWNRVELGWVAYGAIGLGALKLMLEDLRFGNAGTLMVSLLFYGAVLILLPRVTRVGRAEA